MHIRMIGAILVPFVLCSCANMTTARKEFKIENQKSQLIDAKQRSILISQDKIRQNRPIVCAEPSPDALTALAASASGSVTTPSQFGAQLAAALSEQAAYIGLRTQTIQLLRDSYYRLCESYLSGAIDGDEFETMQRKYQVNMIGILAIEQLTGAVRAPTVVLASTSSASSGENISQLLTIREQWTKKKAEKQKQLDEENTKKDEKGNKIEPDKNVVAQIESDVKAVDESIQQIDKRIGTASGPSAQAGTLPEGVK